jgi:hypothetical protein
VPITRADQHVPAVAGERACDLLADTAISAGDQRGSGHRNALYRGALRSACTTGAIEQAQIEVVPPRLARAATLDDDLSIRPSAPVSVCQDCNDPRRRPPNHWFSHRVLAGSALAHPPAMASKSMVVSGRRCDGRATEDGMKGAVIVVGGSGGMSERYRAIVAARGLELRHFENRIPNGMRRIVGRVAAVFIMVGMVSHALRDQVQALVPDGAPVVYLRSASISALRSAVASLDA